MGAKFLPKHTLDDNMLCCLEICKHRATRFNRERQTRAHAVYHAALDYRFATAAGPVDKVYTKVIVEHKKQRMHVDLWTRSFMRKI